MIYKLCIIIVVGFSFWFGRLCSVPFYEIVNRMDVKSTIADKCLINIPKIVSYVLFFNRRNTVTYYSLIYQIIWYVLVIKGVYVFLNYEGSIELMTKQITYPFLILYLAEMASSYIRFKMDNH